MLRRRDACRLRWVCVGTKATAVSTFSLALSAPFVLSNSFAHARATNIAAGLVVQLVRATQPTAFVGKDTAAHLWHLHDASVFAQTNGEGLTQVVAKVFVEREATYYELNIGIILYFIVLAALCSVGIPFDSSQDRFALVVTLMLTSVAFKFVTHEMTPNTPYLTLLDKFMLVGMLTLVGVLAKDFVFALKYQARDGDGDDDDALQDLDQLIVGVTASEKSSNPTNVCG